MRNRWMLLLGSMILSSCRVGFEPAGGFAGTYTLRRAGAGSPVTGQPSAQQGKPLPAVIDTVAGIERQVVSGTMTLTERQGYTMSVVLQEKTIGDTSPPRTNTLNDSGSFGVIGISLRFNSSVKDEPNVSPAIPLLRTASQPDTLMVMDSPREYINNSRMTLTWRRN
jgi:hypothetical protein